MIETRCGLLCGECAYREQVGCPGCLHMEKPFWGERCPIKSCCESKSHAHCGQCSAFPCARDPEQGDKGARIERCRAWAKD